MAESKDDVSSRTILVSNVTEDFKDLLEVFVESKKKGGGDFEQFDYDKDNCIAWITFEDLEVAKRFVENGSIEIQKRQMKVQQAPDSRTLFIHQLPADVDEILECFLESPKKGGGLISDFYIDEQSRTATVKFDSETVARNLLERKSIEIQGHELHFSKLPPICNAVYHESFAEDEEKEEEKEENEENSEEERDDGYQEAVSDPDSTVLIENVPAGMIDFLEFYLENESSGGGTISNFKEDEDGVLVTFEDPEVAKNLLKRGSIQFGETSLNVVPPRSSAANEDPDDQQPTSSVTISQIPRTLSAPILKAILENKKCGGGDVLDLTLDQEQGIAVVQYQDPEVAQRLIESGKIQFKSTTLSVSSVPKTSISANPRLSLSSDASLSKDIPVFSDVPTTPEDSATVVIEKIPANCTEDTFSMLIENPKRSGGGKYTKLSFDEKDRTATVTFEDPNVAEELLKRGEVKYKEFAMPVRTPNPVSRQTSENCTRLSSNSIVLTEISPEIREETLKMFIENKKRSGIGEYESFVLDEHKRTATITLKDPQVVQDLLKRGSLKYGSNVMKIENPCSSTSTTKVSEEPTKTKNHPPESPRTVEIHGHVKDRETLVLYLENRRSGAGPTEDVQILSDSCALVTFEKSEDAMKFAKKGDHSLCNAKLDVILLDSWPNVGGSCAIRVEGFKKGTAGDTLMYFFENKRSGGEPESIEEIHYDGSSQTAVITFKTPSVVRNIIGKGRITLDGCNLDIVALKPARPPPLMLSNNIDSKKLLFTELGLDADVSKLRRFAEAAGKASVVDISFCTKPGVALIQYANVPNYCHVREVLCSKPFQGRMISVQRISIPTSIQVHNIGKLTEETLTLYFESHRSGGGEIKKFKMLQQKNCAVIEFNNTNVIETVLAKNHKVSEQDLDVKPYIHSIGFIPPGFNSSLPFQELPPDIDVTCNPDIVNFIRKNLNLKKEFEHQMKLKYCFVNWPRNRNDPAKLHCTIPPGHSNLIKSWKDVAEQQFYKEMEKYVFTEIMILQEVWKKFKKALDSGYQKPKEEELLLHFDKSKCVVLMCGLKSHAEMYEKCVNQVKAQLEEELERSKKEIKDEAGLKPHQLYLLKAANFFNQPSNDVRCQETDRGVVFEGQPTAVRAAKLQMYQQFLGDIVETSIDHVNFVKLLNHSKVRSHLHNCFQRMNVAATFEVVNNDVKIFGNGQTSVDVAEKVLKQELIQFSKDLDKSNRDCIQTREWDSFKSGLIQEFETVDIVENKDGVAFVMLKDDVANVKEKVEGYFDKNAILSQFLPTERGVVEVLKRYAEKDMDKVKSENKQNEIDIKLVLDSNKCGCSISGNRKGLERAAKAMKELINKVLKDKYPVDKTGAIKFFQNENTKYMIQGIAEKNSVVLKYSNEENSGHGKDNTGRGKDNGHGGIFHGDPILYSHVLVNRSQASVKLFLGDITRCKGDTIINAANSKMAPGSGVAGAIADAGGDEIEKECADYVRKQGELKPGVVYVSRPGKLPHNSVIHTVGPMFNRNYPQGSNDELKQAVSSALKEADNRMNKSVVMPLISCGVYGFPADKAALIISDTVVNFLERSTNVKEVNIVNGDTAKLDITLAALIQNSGVNVVQKPSSTSAKSSYDFKSPSKSRMSSSQQPMRYKTPEGISVELIVGSIADQKADVLFDSTEKDMDLSKAAVSKSMLSIAGSQLQSECKSKCPAGGISYGEIIQTAGYRLPCKAVYHSACPRWDEGKGSSEKCIRKMLSEALGLADKDGMTSIAFPAIGTGKLRFPGRVVANAMFDEVQKFSRSVKSSSVTDVRIVIFDKPTVEDFVKELKNLTGDNNSSSEDDSPGNSSPRSHQHKRRGDTSDSSPRSQPRRRHSNSSATSTSSELAKFDCTMNDINFEVKLGDITCEKCDAIVNSTNYKLNVSIGALSKAIVRAAGDAVEDECKKLGKVTDGMAITGAGRLQCKHIFHLVAKDVKEWKTVIGNMLMAAEKMNLTSITMPPLGTGHHSASVEDMGEAIMDVVYDFSKTKPKHLRKISVAIRDREMLSTFASAVEKAGKKQGNFFQKIAAKIESIFGHDSSSDEEATGGYVKVPKDRRPVRSSHEKVSEKQKFDLMIYSLERRSIESTKRELQKLSQTAENEAVLDNSLIKEAVSKISEDQKRKFKDLERLHSIKIAYGAEGIRLIGDREETSKAMPKVYEIIMSAMNSEKETRELELFAKNAIWRYQEKDKMVEYGIYANGTIERAHHEKKNSVEWTSKKGNIKHKVDFKTMIDDRQPGGPAKVTRSVKGSTVIPYRWEQMSPDKVYSRVDVKSGTEEYNKVVQNLQSTAQNMVQTVIKVERIQNPGLYRQYMNRKQFMDEANKSAGIKDNEKRLWHGTSPANIENINSRNFNRSYSGVHGLAIGNGVYFATTSAYSIRGYCQADTAGNKFIYQARVLTGQTTKGVQGLKEAPPLPGRTDATFDSVSDNPAAPGMFVVFYDYQMYPEYLITFK